MSEALPQKNRKQKYLIFGDPALMLNLPRDSVRIERINATDVLTDTATVAALSLVSIKGTVCDDRGKVRVHRGHGDRERRRGHRRLC